MGRSGMAGAKGFDPGLWEIVGNRADFEEPAGIFFT
jgi:hypothetical protein